MATSPISWFGGKFYLAKKIIQIMPKHEVYVEPFGGAAWVLFKKTPSKIEVYNDIDFNLVNFFRVLKNKEKFEKLKELVELAIYSRELLSKSKVVYDKNFSGTDIERAFYFFVLVKQSYSSTLRTWGFSVVRNKAKDIIPTNFDQAFRRLSNVIIENDDFRNVIRKYDSEKTLFYLDPPYVKNTRSWSGVYYKFELSDKDHEDLVNLVLNVKGKVIISGFDNEIYRKLEKCGWKKLFFEVSCITGISNRNAFPKYNKASKRQEFVWCNFSLENSFQFL